MKQWTATILLTILACSVCAEVKLPAIFGSSMVLQQKSDAAVWGWADAGEQVEVLGSWMKSPAAVKADKEGLWQVKIKTPAAGGPFTLTIKASNTLVLQDVLIGEVWICSGQSNMEWPMNAVDNAQLEIKAANFPQIRLFTVKKESLPQPQKDCVGQWTLCTPETVSSFSAVGYLFGREIHQKLNIPIGLINASWGGTPVEAWISQKGIQAFKDYQPILQKITRAEQPIADEVRTTNEKALARWEEQVAAVDPGTKENWQDPKMDVSGWKEMEQPREWTGTELENIDGIVWFRRITNIPPSWAKTELELHLGQIDDIDTVWVNGVKIGSMTDWLMDRRYSIPASALHIGPNVIAVRIVDTGSQGGFRGEESQMRIGPVGAKAETCATIAKTWKYKVSLAEGPLPPSPRIITGKFNQNSPTTLFNGMIAPLTPYRIAGALWYQGESNVGRPAEYARLFPAMITDWRKQFNSGNFSFYWVQIAPFAYADKNSAYLREAQTQSLKTVKNGGMAVTMDIGAVFDIHPRNKQDVAKRLALWALAKNYAQKDIACSGPIYKSMKVEGQKIRLRFDYIYGGLSATDGHLTDFVIAGADRKFVPAEAVIEGDTIVVSSSQVQKPIAVRYGWTNWVAGSLFNKEGLPASSFRTDDWNDNTDDAVNIASYQN
jgi:sialate O-acetylesterase